MSCAPCKKEAYLGELRQAFDMQQAIGSETSRSRERLLTTKEAADYLGMSPAFLERDRWAGAQISFIRVGVRAVRYRKDDLDAYVASRFHHSNPECAA